MLLLQVMQGSGAVMAEYRKAKGELRIVKGQLHDTRHDLESTKEQVGDNPLYRYAV